jgi:hypothetical protein
LRACAGIFGRLAVLLGGALVSGCSLSDLVFDRVGTGGAGGASASSGGGGSMGSSGGMGGGGGGGAPDCIPFPSSGSASSTAANCANGRLDCNALACTNEGFSCIRPPDGWNGPGVFSQGPPDTVPCCPSEYPKVALVGGDIPLGDPVTCGACSCLANHSCQPGELRAHPTNACDMLAVVPHNETCQPLTVIPATVAFSAAAPTLTLSATCTATGGEVTSSPPRWSIVAQLCSAEKDVKGCSGGRFCSRPSAEFGNVMCFWRAGISDCPAGFSEKHTFFSEFDDKRGCSACPCGSPDPGGSCSETTALYSSMDCLDETTKLADLQSPATCFQQAGVLAYKATTTVNQPSCPAGVSTPTPGKVEPKLGSEITVCCGQ